MQAASLCGGAHGAQAKRFMTGTRAKGSLAFRRPAAPRAKARPRSNTVRDLTSLNQMRSANVLAVKGKLHDGTSPDDLREWVVAIAFGKSVTMDI